MKKRILAACLSLALVFGLMPTVTFAQPASPEPNPVFASDTPVAQDTTGAECVTGDSQYGEGDTSESTPAATTTGDKADAQLTLLGGPDGNYGPGNNPGPCDKDAGTSEPSGNDEPSYTISDSQPSGGYVFDASTGGNSEIYFILYNSNGSKYTGLTKLEKGKYLQVANNVGYNQFIAFFVKVPTNELLTCFGSSKGKDYYDISEKVSGTNISHFPDNFKTLVSQKANNDKEYKAYLGFTLDSGGSSSDPGVWTIYANSVEPDIDVALTAFKGGQAIDENTVLSPGNTISLTGTIKLTDSIKTTKIFGGIGNVTSTVSEVAIDNFTVGSTTLSNGNYSIGSVQNGTVQVTVNSYTVTESDINNGCFTASISATAKYENTVTYTDASNTTSTTTTHSSVSGSDKTTVSISKKSVVYKTTADTSDTFATQSQYVGTEVDVIADTPKREGWTFDGWTSSDVTVDNGKFTMPNKNVVFVARWVRYEDNGNGTHNVISDNTGNVVRTEDHSGEGDTCEKCGACLHDKGEEGNCLESECSHFNNKDCCKKTVKLTYDANGGKDAPSAESQQSTNSSITFSISTTEPTRTGYDFEGWSTKDDDTVYKASGDNASIEISSDTTLYAHWKAKTYTVTYECNGGVGDFGSVSIGVTSENGVMTYTIPEDYKSEKSGFTFEGWAVNGATYQPGISIDLTDSITLVAQWKKNGTDNWKDTEEKPSGGGEDNQIGGDGIDDKYQVLVIFNAGDHGAFSSGTEVYQVFTLRANGNLTTSGTVTPSSIDAPTPQAGYEFTGWKDSEGKDANPFGELSVTVQGTHTFTFTAQYEELPKVTVTPQSMTAYVGGDSANLGSHAPKLRYAISDGYGNAAFNLYTVQNGVVSDPVPLTSSPITVGSNTYYMFPELGANWEVNSNNVATDNDKLVQRGDYLKFVDVTTLDDSVDNNSSTYAGVYSIEKRTGVSADWTDWYITATDSEGKVHLVDLNTDGAKLTVRAVSNETGMYESSDVNKNNYLAPLATSEPQFDDSDCNFAAVVNTSTTFTTYGEQNLGILNFTSDKDGEVSIQTTNSLNNIDLLVDDTVSLNSDVTPEELESEMLAAAGVSADDWNSEFKYLDLVNTKDGNAVVEANGSVKIYWPVPDDVDVSKTKFEVKHFEGMDRENVAEYDETNKTITVGNSAVTVTSPEVSVESVEGRNYVTFETSSFSPFVLLWADAESTDTDDSGKVKDGSTDPGTDPGEGGNGTEPDDGTGTDTTGNGDDDNSGTTPGTDNGDDDDTPGKVAGDFDDGTNGTDGTDSADGTDDGTTPGTDGTDDGTTPDDTGKVAGDFDDGTNSDANTNTDTNNNTNGEGVTGNTNSSDNSNSADGADKKASEIKSALAKTGDVALVGAAGLVLIALAAAAGAWVLRRRATAATPTRRRPQHRR